MKWKQIRFGFFLALCEENNFTRAAKRCGVSQPSVSNAIKRLEEELGGDLFHRTKNGAKLSPLGVAIRPYLDQINECAEGVRRGRHIFQQPTWSQFRRERSLRAKFFTVPHSGLCSFCWSTIELRSLLREGNAFCGESNCRRSRFGSDNRYETSAAKLAVRGLSIARQSKDGQIKYRGPAKVRRSRFCVRFWGKRTSQFALQMSAYDPKRIS